VLDEFVENIAVKLVHPPALMEKFLFRMILKTFNEFYVPVVVPENKDNYN
jgi:hypothetical protein